MGRRSTTGGVRAAGDRIEFRFTWQGKELRPTRQVRPTATALAQARRDRAVIVDEIRLGTFSLARWFPDYRFKARHEAPGADSQRTFGQWAEAWAAVAARSLEHSTLTIYRRHLDAYWVSAWRDLRAPQITHTMVLERLALLAADHVDEATGTPRKALGRKTQNNIMIPLRGVFELICKSLPALADPTAGIENLKVQQGEPDPFTREEVELALAACFKRHEALGLYFEFACFAGLRPSEQIALTWLDIDFNHRSARVSHAHVLGQEKDRTKTHRARVVEFNDRAWAVIQRQRALTQAKTPTKSGRVFYNPWTDKPWNCEAEQRREWVDALRRAGVRYRPPKECRDTSVTLALLAGADPYWVAAQHGHSVTTMLRDYARWIPRADGGRNRNAVNRAIGKPGEADSAVEAQ